MCRSSSGGQEFLIQFAHLQKCIKLNLWPPGKQTFEGAPDPSVDLPPGSLGVPSLLGTGFSHGHGGWGLGGQSTFAWNMLTSPGWGDVHICMYVWISPHQPT